MRYLCLITLAGIFLSGCSWWGGLRQDAIVKHPDASMLITEGKGYAKVAVYEKAGNRLIEYGWIGIDECKGWTIHKFNWEAYIAERGDD